MLVADIDALRAVGMVLATASPRRVEIVNGILGLQARVVSSTFEENLDKSLYTPVEYVEVCSECLRRLRKCPPLPASTARLPPPTL